MYYSSTRWKIPTANMDALRQFLEQDFLPSLKNAPGFILFVLAPGEQEGEYTHAISAGIWESAAAHEAWGNRAERDPAVAQHIAEFAGQGEPLIRASTDIFVIGEK